MKHGYSDVKKVFHGFTLWLGGSWLGKKTKMVSKRGKLNSDIMLASLLITLYVFWAFFKIRDINLWRLLFLRMILRKLFLLSVAF